MTRDRFDEITEMVGLTPPSEPRIEKCPSCSGWGFHGEPAAVAKGYGKVNVTVNTCITCGGSGQIAWKPVEEAPRDPTK